MDTKQRFASEMITVGNRSTVGNRAHDTPRSLRERCAHVVKANSIFDFGFCNLIFKRLVAVKC